MGPAVVLTTTVDDVEAPGVEVGAAVVAESVSVAVDRELVAAAETCVVVVGIRVELVAAVEGGASDVGPAVDVGEASEVET